MHSELLEKENCWNFNKLNDTLAEFKIAFENVGKNFKREILVY